MSALCAVWAELFNSFARAVRRSAGYKDNQSMVQPLL